ncbi:PREDICTED: discoidin, CUB and LCCL domain-containing protein 2-like isoform X2 [Acropora digitifera]|uniref:discoidin, CUB and LCCL domain-containing protein 2-like isoform X2 n=1 Tax=Acropora digitifera TaxID=70779 RepID=UPI00077B1419|nr:PREDICTED: discoidin, CUB and LCCL domain-containing protein 2-like isoform X2 [Acropora digitifera]
MKLTWLRDTLLRSSRPFRFAFLFVFCSKLILFSLVEGDECRQIEFGDALSNSRLSKDHVIRVYHVQNEPNCKVKCFLEPDCVAYNYGKDYEGNLQCELCNKSHLQVPSNHVMVTPGFIFRPVAENPCITNPCPHSFTCQVGFRDQGYRCVSACNRSLGMESGKILHQQITASSQWNALYAAHQGRLNFQEVVEGGVLKKSGSWSALIRDQNQWLQVDLLHQEIITSVATQGRNKHPLWKTHKQWVNSYKLQYSNNGIDFEYYKDARQNSAKVFAGNNDRDSIVRHYLNPTIRARYIRFQPIAWNTYISMRVGLNGC